MKRIILFDVDGLVVKKPAKRFSERYAKEFGVKVPMGKIKSFFETEFQLCLEGKADLKQVIGLHLLEWNWPKSTDELLEYWFSGDSEPDTRFEKLATRLRGEGISCYLATNNEKYRTAYLARKLNLRTLFDDIFASCEVGALKSREIFWEKVHKRLGSPQKQDVTVWDDDQANVDAASMFGYDAHFYYDFAEFEKWVKQNNTQLLSSSF